MSNQQKIIVTMVALVCMALLYLLKPILTPFLVAGIFAYLGDPLVERLVRLKLPRTLVVALVFVFIMAIVTLAIVLLIPQLNHQLELFIDRLPQFLVWIQQIGLPWITQSFGVNFSLDPNFLKTAVTTHWQQAGNLAATIWQTISHSGLAFFAGLAKLLLIPVVTFYLMRDWPAVVNSARRLLPRRSESTVMNLWHECDEVLGAFVRGQLSVMLGLGVIYSIGLSIAGLDLALFVGMLAGLLSMVPYLGAIIGIVAAGIAAFVQYHDSLHLIYVAIVFVIGHLIESMVLTPWLVGDRIGLHPVAVIFAIFAGGHLFGFVGVLLALPIAAVLMVLIRHLKQRYLASNFYQN